MTIEQTIATIGAVVAGMTATTMIEFAKWRMQAHDRKKDRAESMRDSQKDTCADFIVLIDGLRDMARETHTAIANNDPNGNLTELYSRYLSCWTAYYSGKATIRFELECPEDLRSHVHQLRGAAAAYGNAVDTLYACGAKLRTREGKDALELADTSHDEFKSGKDAFMLKARAAFAAT